MKFVWVEYAKVAVLAKSLTKDTYDYHFWAVKNKPWHNGQQYLPTLKSLLMKSWEISRAATIQQIKINSEF